MQNSYFINKKRRSRLSVFLVGILIGTGVFYYFTHHSVEEVVTADEAKAFVPEAPSSINMNVSGIVEAGESLTLYAKRAGFVRQVLVTEGDQVSTGDAILLSVDPVTEARLGVTEIAGALRVLEAKSSVASAANQNNLAGIAYEQSIALSALTASDSEESARQSAKQLEAALSQVEALLPQALRFVQDNKSLFTSESMDTYTEVVSAFYGGEPSYLRIGVTDASSGNALLDEVAKTKNASSSELLAVAKNVNVEFAKLLNLYQASESEFFDEDELSSDSAVLAGYSELRSAIAELSSGLAAATLGASSYGIGAEISGVTTSGNVASAKSNSDTASAVNDIMALIEGRSADLSNQELALVAAEMGLGLTEAPFAGVVTEVLVEKGQYVNAGEPLVRFSGTGVKEMKVKLSGIGQSVSPGAAFLLKGKTVGQVDRVVPVLEAGSVTAYVVINDENLRVGEVVRGEVALGVPAGYKAVARDYVQFDEAGAYVTTKAGETVHLTIVHDTGAVLVVEPERELNEELVPAYGVRL